MRIPAVLVCESAPSGPTVASLTTLERLLVAVHRAGCGPIVLVAGGPLPQFRRAAALGVRFEVAAMAPVLPGPVFVASSNVLLTAGDVARLIEQRGRLTKEGQFLPAGVVERVSGSLEDDLRSLPKVEALGVAGVVTDAASARAVTRALWASLTSPSDGFVDRHFNRPVGRLLSKVLIYTPITPNQISVAATLLGIVSAVCFGLGSASAALFGAVLLQISAIIDCVDGDVARAVFKESPLGKWLDIVGDQVVHIGVFVAIGIGLWRAGVDAPVLALASSAGAGVLISFAVVLRGLLNPDPQKNSPLQRLIDATTNRDFSVLLLVLAATNRLEWFLWLAALGVHAFWLLALSLQIRRRTPASA